MKAQVDDLLKHPNFPSVMKKLTDHFGQFPLIGQPPIGTVLFSYGSKKSVPYVFNRGIHCVVGDRTYKSCRDSFDKEVFNLLSYCPASDDPVDQSLECLEGNSRTKGTFVGLLEGKVNFSDLFAPCYTKLYPRKDRDSIHIKSNISAPIPTAKRLRNPNTPYGEVIFEILGEDAFDSLLDGQISGLGYMLAAYADYVVSDLNTRDNWWSYGSIYVKYRTLVEENTRLLTESILDTLPPSVIPNLRLAFIKASNIVGIVKQDAADLKKEKRDFTAYTGCVGSAALIPFLMTILLGNDYNFQNKSNTSIAKAIIKHITFFSNNLKDLTHGSKSKLNRLSYELLEVLEKELC